LLHRPFSLRSSPVSGLTALMALQRVHPLPHVLGAQQERCMHACRPAYTTEPWMSGLSIDLGSFKGVLPRGVRVTCTARPTRGLPARRRGPADEPARAARVRQPAGRAAARGGRAVAPPPPGRRQQSAHLHPACACPPPLFWSRAASQPYVHTACAWPPSLLEWGCGSADRVHAPPIFQYSRNCFTRRDSLEHQRGQRAWKGACPLR